MIHKSTEISSRLALPPLSLYIHIPWCVRKCPYCDFNSHAKEDNLPIAEYCKALNDDLKLDAHWAQGREIQSIFFGGGTPSLFPASAIEQILDAVRQQLSLAKGAEVTLETNPGTAEYSDFSGLRRAGVNRLSFGAQSFDDLQLQQLGRIHSAEEIYKAINKATQAGFDNFNIDLMHSLPGQTPERALKDIEQALSLSPKHLSWYQLTIEPNTAFYSTPPVLPTDDIQAEIYREGLAFLKLKGFQQYEVSAFAQAGFESRHNLNYWEFGDYLAIGAGAHGKITLPKSSEIIRMNKTRQPSAYLDARKSFTAKCAAIKNEDLVLEFMMNALRLNHGVKSALFTPRTGLKLQYIEDKLKILRQKGLLSKNAARLTTSKDGHYFLNEVLEQFLD